MAKAGVPVLCRNAAKPRDSHLYDSDQEQVVSRSFGISTVTSSEGAGQLAFSEVCRILTVRHERVYIRSQPLLRPAFISCPCGSGSFVLLKGTLGFPIWGSEFRVGSGPGVLDCFGFLV